MVKIKPMQDNAAVKTEGSFERSHGLNWLITGLVLVGELAGAGLVALPTAFVQAGLWTALTGNMFVACVVTYTAHLLGKCWVILQQRWPEYRRHCRQPYAEIGYRAMGNKAKKLVTLCVYLSSFGSAVVMILLASHNLHDVTATLFNLNISYCAVILILTACVWPLTLLKSPQDFWHAIVLAMISTFSAVVLICVGSYLDYPTCSTSYSVPPFRLVNALPSLGTFLFAYGGHSSFPTIQHDMKKPAEFGKSAVLGYSIVFPTYTLVGLVGYVTYGGALRGTVLQSLQTPWMHQTANIFISLHCILALLIFINPVMQEVEEYFKAPHEFGFQRVLYRSVVLLAVTFVAESVPNFGPFLDLVGGSVLTMTSVVFPSLFYLYLNAGLVQDQGKQDSTNDRVSLTKVVKAASASTLVLCCACMAFGMIAGSGATYSAIRELSSTRFALPCYVVPFMAAKESETVNGLNCCGVFQNISRYSYQCATPTLHFYGA